MELLYHILIKSIDKSIKYLQFILSYIYYIKLVYEKKTYKPQGRQRQHFLWRNTAKIIA